MHGTAWTHPCIPIVLLQQYEDCILAYIMSWHFCQKSALANVLLASASWVACLEIKPRAGRLLWDARYYFFCFCILFSITSSVSSKTPKTTRGSKFSWLLQQWENKDTISKCKSICSKDQNKSNYRIIYKWDTFFPFQFPYCANPG